MDIAEGQNPKEQKPNTACTHLSVGTKHLSKHGHKDGNNGHCRLLVVGMTERWVEKLPIGYSAHYLGAIHPCNSPPYIVPVSKIKAKIKEKKKKLIEI